MFGKIRSLRRRVTKLLTPLLLTFVLVSSLVLPLADATPVQAAAPADCYWVGGTGLWSDDDNHWAIASGGAAGDGNLPDATSNVFFDASSFTGAGQSVTVDATAACLSMNWTAATNIPTLAGAAALRVYGNLTLITDMVVTLSNAMWLTGTGAQNIITSGQSLATLSVFAKDGTGTVQLLDSLNLGTKPCQTGAGTLNTNGQTVTCGVFKTTTAAAKTITLGASIINCTDWNMIVGGGTVTLTANTATINVAGTGAFFGGGLTTYNNVNLNGTAHTISDSNTFANLTRTGTATKTDTLTLTSETTQTVTGVFTIAGDSATNRLLVQSSTLGTAANITVGAGNFTASNADFMDFAATNAVDLSAIAGLSGDCGGNTGITFTATAAQTWDGTTGSWSTAAKWTSRVPLPQDDVSAGGAGNTITVDMPRIGKSVTFTGTPTVSLSNDVSNYGSLTLASGMTYTYVNKYNVLRGRSAYTLTSNGQTIYGVLQYMPTGTMTLQDTLTAAIDLYLRNGTFSFNNQDATATSYSQGADTIANLGSGTLIFNSSAAITKWAANAGVVNAGTSTILLTNSGTSAQTFAGGGLTYNNITVAGAGNYALTVSSSNTFNDFKVDASQVAKTIKFTDGTTTVLSDLTRDPGGTNIITFNGTAAAGWSVNKTDATDILLDYLNISYSTADPATTFYAGTHSVDTIGNAGWVFADAALTTTTLAATGITMDRDGVTGGTFNGTITTLAGTPYISTLFNYGTTVGYGSNTTPVNKYSYGAYSANIPVGLTPGETYHFRSAIVNGAGTFTGADAQFTLTMPTVTTGGSAQSGFDATLTGTVATMGEASGLYAGFEWGYDTSYGHSTTLTTMSGTGDYTKSITGYDPASGNVIHYRSIVTVGSVSAYGADATFVPSGTIPGAYRLATVLPIIFLTIIVLSLVAGLFTGSFTIAALVGLTLLILVGLAGLGAIQAALRALWGG